MSIQDAVDAFNKEKIKNEIEVKYTDYIKQTNT